MMERSNITGIILAGGKSTRMGTDKGFIKLNGVTFIEHVIASMHAFVNDIIIVSNNPDYDTFGYTRIDDLIEDSGPLAGLYTGLSYSTTEYNLVLSCDVPLINNEILVNLISGMDESYDIVQLKSQDKTIPLIAIYKKHCLFKCLELLDHGEKRLRMLAQQLNTKTITIGSDLEQYVKNINTQNQLSDILNEVEH